MIFSCNIFKDLYLFANTNHFTMSSLENNSNNKPEMIFSLDHDDESNDKLITITTNDGVNFEVLDKHLSHSNMLRTVLEDKECKHINLDLVSSQQFMYILDYIKELEANNCLHSDIPKPVIDTTMREHLKDWENNFINRVHKEGMLAKTAETANYLDVSPLLELACAKIAALLKGKINSNEIEGIIQSL